MTTLDLTPDELSKVRLAVYRVYRETCRMTRRDDPEWHALLDRLDAALADEEATT